VSKWGWGGGDGYSKDSGAWVSYVDQFDALRRRRIDHIHNHFQQELIAVITEESADSNSTESSPKLDLYPENAPRN
jgi:hypothetical protein